MPFDVMIESPVTRRFRLIEALRTEMPENITFNYMTVYRRHDCGSTVCALGLASIMFPEHRDILLGGYEKIEQQADLFGITVCDADNIFWGQGRIYRAATANGITPDMVASALERA